jgi:hypothetical protein
MAVWGLDKEVSEGGRCGFIHSARGEQRATGVDEGWFGLFIDVWVCSLGREKRSGTDIWRLVIVFGECQTHRHSRAKVHFW